jgi:DNA-binding helix-hairpin-helix protein with protein kinase domain
LVLAALSVFVWPRVPAQKRSAASNAVAAARAGWEAASAKWDNEASQEIFKDKLELLAQARRQLHELPNERKKRLAVLDAERQEKQLQRYLDRFRIDKASITAIGAGRTAMLASFGIETAADIDRYQILQIQGFGDVLTSNLEKWKAGHVRRFKFNPSEPIDPRDVSALEQDLENRAKKLVADLQGGQRALTRLSQEIIAARPRLMPHMERAWLALKLAEAAHRAI